MLQPPMSPFLWNYVMLSTIASLVVVSIIINHKQRLLEILECFYV
jgi:hypothetical protein